MHHLFRLTTFKPIKAIFVFFITLSWVFSPYTHLFTINVFDYNVALFPAPQTAKAASLTASPGTIVNTADATNCVADSNNAWVNPSNASSQNDTYTEVTDGKFDANESSERLDVTNFSFSIPAGSTIDGIVVEIDKYDGTSDNATDQLVKLFKGGVLTGDNKADTVTIWPTSDTDSYISYGSSSDTWGASWTADDINASDFGVAICAYSGGNNQDVYIDHVRITVHYTETGARLQQSHYRWRADHKDETGTTWLATEDTLHGSEETASTTRLRILVDNDTGLNATTTLYQLEYATSTIAGYTGCSALSTWDPVLDAASSTSFIWKTSPSANISDGGATTDNTGLTNPAGNTFVAGETRDISNRTASSSLSINIFTEHEWALEAGERASGHSYCFRMTNADDSTHFTYTAYPRISMATSTELDLLHYRWRADNLGEGSNAWWNENFKDRRKISFNNIPSSENLIDFPMLIELTDNSNSEFGANIDFSKVLPKGDDIRFVDADDSTMLKHEIEKWDETATSSLWVKIPQLNGTSTSDYIWMYYNNTATSSGSATSSVWDSNFIGVWHLGEGDSTASNFYKDSTSNANHGTLTDTDGNSASVAGRVGNAFEFSSDDTDFITTGSNELKTAANMTLEAFFNGNGIVDDNVYHLLWEGKAPGDGGGTEEEVGLSIGEATANDFTQQYSLFLETETDDVVVTGDSLGGDNTNWHYIAGTIADIDTASPDGIVYKDGMSNATDSGDSETRSTWNTNMRIGSTGQPDRGMDGVIDEARISNIVRSAQWIQATYRFIFASSTTHMYGTEETLGGSFLAAEDTHLTGQDTASTTRLRFVVDELSDSSATTTMFQLEYATSTVAGFTTCSALSTWVSVQNAASSTSYAWMMSPSGNITDQVASSTTDTGDMTNPDQGDFTGGETLDINARTSAIVISQDNFTELEWSMEATSEADGDSYCFRVTNADDATDFTYTVYARISMATTSVTFTQSQYRLYEDNDTLTPGTVWDSLGENEAMNADKRIGGGEVVRLRMNVTAGGALDASSQAFALEYAELSSGACSDLTSWISVGAKGSSVAFRLTNTSQGDSTTLTTLLLTNSDVAGLLSEINPSITNPNSASSQEIEYDWPVEYSEARISDATFCFRMTKNDNTALTTYTNYPQILTNIVGSGSDSTVGAPVGGSGGKGVATTTGGTQGGGGEDGGSGSGGSGQQGGGGSGGGGEVFLPFFRSYAAVLTSMVDLVAEFVRWKVE